MDVQMRWLVLCVAIIALTTIEVVALSKGLDGAMFGGVIAIIGGLAGYRLARGRKRGQDQ